MRWALLCEAQQWLDEVAELLSTESTVRKTCKDAEYSQLPYLVLGRNVSHKNSAQICPYDMSNLISIYDSKKNSHRKSYDVRFRLMGRVIEITRREAYVANEINNDEICLALNRDWWSFVIDDGTAMACVLYSDHCNNQENEICTRSNHDDEDNRVSLNEMGSDTARMRIDAVNSDFNTSNNLSNKDEQHFGTLSHHMRLSKGDLVDCIGKFQFFAQCEYDEVYLGTSTSKGKNSNMKQERCMPYFIATSISIHTHNPNAETLRMAQLCCKVPSPEMFSSTRLSDKSIDTSALNTDRNSEGKTYMIRSGSDLAYDISVETGIFLPSDLMSSLRPFEVINKNIENGGTREKFKESMELKISRSHINNLVQLSVPEGGLTFNELKILLGCETFQQAGALRRSLEEMQIKYGDIYVGKEGTYLPL